MPTPAALGVVNHLDAGPQQLKQYIKQLAMLPAVHQVTDADPAHVATMTRWPGERPP